MNNYVPIKSRKSSRLPTPWMTSEIAKLMSDRDFHLRKAKGNKSSHHWMKYKKLRNNVHRHIEEAKSNYFTSLLQDCGGDSSKLWKAFKFYQPNRLLISQVSKLMKRQSSQQNQSLMDLTNFCEHRKLTC